MRDYLRLAFLWLPRAWRNFHGCGILVAWLALIAALTARLYLSSDPVWPYR